MKKVELVKVDCRNCIYHGHEGDYMVFCSNLGCFRSFGLRYCTMYKLKK